MRHSSPASTLLVALALGALLVLAATLLGGCTNAPRHQRGGSTAQTLGTAPAIRIAPAQTLQQPENPEGESRQVIVRTITTTTPAGDTITTTEKAETVIGGSQSLADILKEYAAADYIRRLAMALIIAVIAYRVRVEWPTISWGLGIGAAIVAFYGLPAVIGCAVFGGAVFLTYHVVRSKLAAPSLP